MNASDDEAPTTFGFTNEELAQTFNTFSLPLDEPDEFSASIRTAANQANSRGDFLDTLTRQQAARRAALLQAFEDVGITLTARTRLLPDGNTACWVNTIRFFRYRTLASVLNYFVTNFDDESLPANARAPTRSKGALPKPSSPAESNGPEEGPYSVAAFPMANGEPAQQPRFRVGKPGSSGIQRSPSSGRMKGQHPAVKKQTNTKRESGAQTRKGHSTKDPPWMDERTGDP